MSTDPFGRPRQDAGEPLHGGFRPPAGAAPASSSPLGPPAPGAPAPAPGAPASPPGTPVPYRPMALAQVLDVALRILWRHLRTLVLVSLAIVGPVALLQLGVSLTVIESVDDGVPAYRSDAGMVADLVVGQLLGALASLVATVAVFRVVAAARAGEEAGVRESLGFAAQRLPAALWIAVLFVLALIPALVAFVLPAIWLGVAFSLAFAVLCAEDLRGRRALARSFRLVRGRWWPVFGALVVVGLLAGIVGGIAGAAIGLLAVLGGDLGVLVYSLLTYGLGALVAAVTTPLTAAVVVVLYFDLRARKEERDPEPGR